MDGCADAVALFGEGSIWAACREGLFVFLFSFPLLVAGCGVPVDSRLPVPAMGGCVGVGSSRVRMLRGSGSGLSLRVVFGFVPGGRVRVGVLAEVLTSLGGWGCGGASCGCGGGC